jgi:hypothetical protein
MGSADLPLPFGHVAHGDDPDQPAPNREYEEKQAASVRPSESIETILHRGMLVVVGQQEWLVEKDVLSFAPGDTV